MTIESSQSKRRRIERLEALAAENAAKLARHGIRPDQYRFPRDVRLAVTVSGQSGAYPSEDGTGNPKFPIKFVDATFTPSIGREALTTQVRSDPEAEYDVLAANITEEWIPPGTLVIAMWQRPPVGISTEDGGEWFIELHKPRTGRILGIMQDDRTRETDASGQQIGYAQVTITSILGEVGHSVGDTVQVAFGDDRWLGAVQGCTVIADYIDTTYSVTECQELEDAWFITLEDRTPGAPQQDVKVAYLHPIGHTNGDFPATSYTPNPPQCPSVTWRWKVAPVNAWIPIDLPQDLGCCIFDSNTAPNDPDDINIPDQEVTTYNNFRPGDDCEPDPQQAELKVRYLADTYPRMKRGAIVRASHNNDYLNKTSNDGMRWIVDVSDQLTNTISGKLPSNNCGDDFEASEIDPAWGAWPFSQEPDAPLQIENDHKGLATDWWVAEWNEDRQKYVVIDMETHKVTIREKFRTTYDEETECYTDLADEQEVWIERCKDPVEVTLRTYKKSTVHRIDALRLDKGESGSGSGLTCTPKQIIDVTPYQVESVCESEQATTIEMELAIEAVMRELADVGNCKHPVVFDAIVFGACGDDETLDSIMCKEPCPTPGSLQDQDGASLNDQDGGNLLEQ